MLRRVQTHPQLLVLMEEALRVCMMLKKFSEEKQIVFLGEDDHAIVEAIQGRETIIDMLIHLEYRIDLVLDEVDEYAYGDALPPEAEAVRHTIREILSTVMDMDIEVMKHVHFRMQKYKDETLKARNKKHLSAYIRTNLSPHSHSSYDYKK